MANARALDKRRKSIRNIRKITRTMELIATARFKKAMDRATAATAYTKRITQLVADLAKSGLGGQPSAAGTATRNQERDAAGADGQSRSVRRLQRQRDCGTASARLARTRRRRSRNIRSKSPANAASRRSSSARSKSTRRFTTSKTSPSSTKSKLIANRYLEDYTTGKLDRLDVAYTRFVSSSKQIAVVETLLPLGSLAAMKPREDRRQVDRNRCTSSCPRPRAFWKRSCPTSFKVKLFKCFLDAAVSEQIARMVAMKSRHGKRRRPDQALSMTYNRARQSQITGEIMEIIGGVEALKRISLQGIASRPVASRLTLASANTNHSRIQLH